MDIENRENLVDREVKESRDTSGKSKSVDNNFITNRDTDDSKDDLQGNAGLENIAHLLGCAFIVAIASIVYELIMGGISSYLLGNSVYQFSITIGLFMTAMGFGSLFSKYLEDNLASKFILIEIILALVGGSSAFILFYSFAVLKFYLPIMFAMITIIGILTGFELPLITRIIGGFDHLKNALANATAADYIGGLVGSVVFPILLLPHLGFIKTSYIIGILNILVAAYLTFRYRFKRKGIFTLLIILVLGILITGVFTVGSTESFLERQLYRDKVVYSRQSQYQKIVMTKDRDDLRLFLNGNIQFSSRDEYRYHESLIHPAFSLAEKRDRVLVLGGGDGLAVREILKYPDVKEIDLVDLDKTMTDLAKSSRYLLALNKNSLSNSKVKITNQDGFQYLQNSKKKYDIVVVDLPDPNNESLNKLYTVTFYRMIYRHLNEKGIMVAQSTSPYFAPKCFWIIHNTIQKAGFFTVPYHTYIPSFGDWGFNIGCKGFQFDPREIKINVPTRFLSNQELQTEFVFGEDILAKRVNDVNTLIKPILVADYYQAWDEYDK